MPFSSEAQRRFMHAKHPGIAARWEKHTPNKDLPDKVGSIPSHVQAQVNHMQTPTQGQMGGPAARWSQLLNGMNNPVKQQRGFTMPGAQSGHDETAQYKPTANGTDSAYSGTTIDPLAKEVTANEGEAPPKAKQRAGKVSGPMAVESLLKPKLAQACLAALVGGILDTFSKRGHFPDVDPGLLFDEITKEAADFGEACTLKELDEVKVAFVSQWDNSKEAGYRRVIRMLHSKKLTSNGLNDPRKAPEVQGQLNKWRHRATTDAKGPKGKDYDANMNHYHNEAMENENRSWLDRKISSGKRHHKAHSF